MAVETDGSRFGAGARETLRRGVSAFGVYGRAVRDAAHDLAGHVAKASGDLRALARGLRLYDFLTYGPADPLRRPDAAAAHHLRQHDRPRHPARRHLLPEPVPRLADRCEAREPARAGRDHRRRHRRQRVGGDRPHRARSRPAAGDRGRQEPVPRRRLRGAAAVDRAGARDADPAPPGAGHGHARPRLCPGRHADHRHRPAAARADSCARRAAGRRQPGPRQGQERLDQVPGLADARRPAGLSRDRRRPTAPPTPRCGWP